MAQYLPTTLSISKHWLPLGRSARLGLAWPGLAKLLGRPDWPSEAVLVALNELWRQIESAERAAWQKHSKVRRRGRRDGSFLEAASSRVPLWLPFGVGPERALWPGPSLRRRSGRPLTSPTRLPLGDRLDRHLSSSNELAQTPAERIRPGGAPERVANKRLTRHFYGSPSPLGRPVESGPRFERELVDLRSSSRFVGRRRGRQARSGPQIAGSQVGRLLASNNRK